MRYPGFGQAVGLLAFILAVGLAVGGSAAVAAELLGWPNLLVHPLALGLNNGVMIGAGVALAVRRIGKGAAEALPFRGFRRSWTAPLALSIGGLGILLSEADNLLRSVLPVPEDLAAFYIALVSGSGSLLASGFTLVVVAPLTEELLFRGVILQGFLSRYGAGKAVALSAVLFGAFHMNPWQFPGAVAAGLVLGWWFVRTGSLWPCLIGHAIFNGIPFLTVAALGLDVAGLTSELAGPVTFQPLWLDAVGLAATAAGLAWSRRVAGSGPGSVPCSSQHP